MLAVMLGQTLTFGSGTPIDVEAHPLGTFRPGTVACQPIRRIDVRRRGPSISDPGGHLEFEPVAPVTFRTLFFSATCRALSRTSSLSA